MPIARVIVRRTVISLVTLWIISVLVFAGGQILPGDVARAILGPLADPRSVANLDRQLGLEGPPLVQYWEWIRHVVAGDLGMSYVYRLPVAPFVLAALGYSIKLGAVAFVLVVPASVAAGVWSALHAGRPLDRLITLTGMVTSVLPEFVTGIVLMLIFGLGLKWLPISAMWPAGAGVLTQLRYLVLPSLPLVLVLFGYLSRMARAGTLEVLGSDYVRTAVLKGLTLRAVVWRHVLRNALLPTLSVTATQLGYLMGGLVVIEVLFRYPGLGGLIYAAARDKDFPMLESAVLVVGALYTGAALLADIVQSLLNPRVRLGAAE